MIFTVNNTQGMTVQIYDVQGTEIKGVIRYNTKTREVTTYLIGQHPTISTKKVVMKSIKRRPNQGKSWSVVKVKVKIPGSYILVNGKRH